MSAKVIVEGQGTAGAPAGQIVSVQGVVGGTPQPISGTVTCILPIPVPVSDNAGSLTVDGVFWQATQPVSGTFWQATQPVSGTFWQATQPVSIAATVTVAGDVAHDAIDSGNPVKIGGYARGSAPAAVVNADRVNAWYSLYGAAASFLTDGASNILSTANGSASIGVPAQGLVTHSPIYILAGGNMVRVTGTVGGEVSITTTQLPAALVGGRLDTNVGAWLGSVAPTVGQKTMAASVPVAIASDQSAIATSGSMANIAIIPSQVRGASWYTNPAIVNTGYRGIFLKFDITAVPGVSTVELHVYVYVGGSYPSPIHTTFAAIAIVSTAYYVLYPGATAADYGAFITATRGIAIPGQWGIRIVHTGAGNFTYQVDAVPIP